MSDGSEEIPMFALPVTRSPVDVRDWNVAAVHSPVFEFPETLDLRPMLHEARDQGRQGSCAAMAASAMKEWQERKDVNLNEYMSPQFIYNNRENQDTDGMYGRDVMKILQKVGVCRERTYKYGTVEKVDDIPLLATEEALNFTIRSYAQVYTIDGLKQSLALNGPCWIAFPVYNYGTRMWHDDGSEFRGGHAMAVVGYNNEGFIIRNSWGTNWGESGHCIYSYDDWESHWEIWSVVDENSNWDGEDNSTPVCECTLL